MRNSLTKDPNTISSEDSSSSPQSVDTNSAENVIINRFLEVNRQRQEMVNQVQQEVIREQNEQIRLEREQRLQDPYYQHKTYYTRLQSKILGKAELEASNRTQARLYDPFIKEINVFLQEENKFPLFKEILRKYRLYLNDRNSRKMKMHISRLNLIRSKVNAGGTHNNRAILRRHHSKAKFSVFEDYVIIKYGIHYMRTKKRHGHGYKARTMLADYLKKTKTQLNEHIKGLKRFLSTTGAFEWVERLVLVYLREDSINYKIHYKDQRVTKQSETSLFILRFSLHVDLYLLHSFTHGNVDSFNDNPLLVWKLLDCKMHNRPIFLNDLIKEVGQFKIESIYPDSESKLENLIEKQPHLFIPTDQYISKIDTFERIIVQKGLYDNGKFVLGVKDEIFTNQYAMKSLFQTPKTLSPKKILTFSKAHREEAADDEDGRAMFDLTDGDMQARVKREEQDTVVTRRSPRSGVMKFEDLAGRIGSRSGESETDSDPEIQLKDYIKNRMMQREGKNSRNRESKRIVQEGENISKRRARRVDWREEREEQENRSERDRRGNWGRRRNNVGYEGGQKFDYRNDSIWKKKDQPEVAVSRDRNPNSQSKTHSSFSFLI